VDDLAFNPDGSQVASVGHDGMLRVWDVESRELAWEQIAHESGAQAVTWGLNDGSIATAGRDGQLKWWDAAGTLLDTMQVHSDVIYDVDPKPGTLLVATASWDGTATHWHIYPLPEVLHIMRAHTGRVHRVAWRPDGSRLATLGWDDTVRMWDANAVELAVKHEHMDFITALAWSDDGATVIDVTLDGRAHIWDVGSGDLLETVTGRSVEPTRSADSPDGSRRAAIDDAGIVRIVDTASGTVIMELPGRANAASWSPDGSRLAVAVRNGTITIWSETD
jgi:WD40 repeat protein